ncbi:MAG: hypothetical protein PW788_01530 [Micavibrio sp.]|nr:hypothetical protein [Micavibrio sp.]
MTTLSKEFDKAQPPALMDAQTYRATLEQLLAKGTGYGKTQNVGGFLLQDINLLTETSSGKVETAKTIKVEKFYVVMDIDQYPSEFVRGLVIKDIAKNWGGKTVHERDLNEPDFKGPGLWTLKQGNFEFDYMPADAGNAKSSTWKPNPEAFRVCLKTDAAVNVPVQWGTFVVEKGGTLAIREKDVAGLASALQSIRNGKATAEEALYAKDDKGNTVARFDIYGMEPGFLENNYNPVTLKPETKAAGAAFATRKKAAPKTPGQPAA